MSRHAPIRHLEFGAPTNWLWGWTSSPVVKGLLLLVLGVSLAGLGGTLWRFERAVAEERSLLEAISARGAKPVPNSSAAPRLSGLERQRLNQMIRALNAPWPLLLRQVERVLPIDVIPLLIEPNVEKGIVRLQLEAASPERLLATAQAFQQEPNVAVVRLGAFSRAESGQASGVRLSFEVVLKP